MREGDLSSWATRPERADVGGVGRFHSRSGRKAGASLTRLAIGRAPPKRSTRAHMASMAGRRPRRSSGRRTLRERNAAIRLDPGKKVTSRKQAIAIGLSEARAAAAKPPQAQPFHART